MMNLETTLNAAQRKLYALTEAALERRKAHGCVPEEDLRPLLFLNATIDLLTASPNLSVLALERLYAGILNLGGRGELPYLEFKMGVPTGLMYQCCYVPITENQYAVHPAFPYEHPLHVFLLRQNRQAILPISVAAKTTLASYGKADGSVTLTATGGNGEFEYSLDNLSWQADGTFPNLAGNIPRTGWARQKNLPANKGSVAFTVPEKAAPVPLTLTVTPTHITVFGESTGMVKLTASGGSGAYQYSLDGVAYDRPVTSGSNTFANLPAQSGTAYVRDAADGALVTSQPFTLTQPAATPATISLAISKTTGTQGNQETVTLTSTVTKNQETQFSGRQTFYRNETTPPEGTRFNTATTGLVFSVSFTASMTTEFWSVVTTESGEKKSNVMKITFAAAPVQVQVAWTDVNPHPVLSAGGTPDYLGQGAATIASPTDPIYVDATQAANMYLVIAVDSAVSDRTQWTDGVMVNGAYTPDPFNYGAIPDPTFYGRLTVGGRDYYITRAEIALNTNANNRVRLI